MSNSSKAFDSICIITANGMNLATGFLFLYQNLVVTAMHVVYNKNVSKEDIEVQFPNNKRSKVRFLTLHPIYDLAVLKLEVNVDITPLVAGKLERNSNGFSIWGLSPSKTQESQEKTIITKKHIDEIKQGTKKIGGLEKDILLYKIDTEFGNSGGAILTHDEFVVGIHLGQRKEDNLLKGVGAPISQILELSSTCASVSPRLS